MQLFLRSLLFLEEICINLLVQWHGKHQQGNQQQQIKRILLRKTVLITRTVLMKLSP